MLNKVKRTIAIVSMLVFLLSSGSVFASSSAPASDTSVIKKLYG